MTKPKSFSMKRKLCLKKDADSDLYEQYYMTLPPDSVFCGGAQHLTAFKAECKRENLPYYFSRYSGNQAQGYKNWLISTFNPKYIDIDFYGYLRSLTFETSGDLICFLLTNGKYLNGREPDILNNKFRGYLT